jgi:hypothetical protein
MLHNDPPHIDERMQRIHECILLERGIQPVASAHDGQSEVDAPDWNGSSWRNLDKRNDAPMFAFPRRKARTR